MAIRHHNWLNAQASRRYPLDDNSTGTGDEGTRLNDDILVDAHLRWPSVAGQYAFLGGLTVTDTIVTAVFMAADSPTAAAGFTPMAAVTLPQPINRHQFYPVEPLYPGVGGFVAFGDVGETFSIRFSTPQQGLLAPKVGRPYEHLPIPTMRKFGRVDGLTGLVRIVAGPDVEIVREDVEVDDVSEPQEALVIRLLKPTSERNVLSDYIGPCGLRPESRNCNREGIETINGVSPDCDGDLRIDFLGLVAGPYMSCGSYGAGVTLDQSLGIDDVCTPKTPDRFGGEDLCLPSVSSSSLSSESAGSQPSVSASSSSSSAGSGSQETGEELPFEDDFETLHPSWDTKLGVATVSGGQMQLIDGSRRNVITWDDIGTGDSVGKKLTSRVQLTNTGTNQNGGIILNYHLVDPLTNPRYEYHVVQLNRNNNRVELLRYNGAILVAENFVTPGAPFSLSDWYEVSAEAQQDGDDVRLSVNVSNASNPLWPAVSFSMIASRWGESDGFYGVHANRAAANFTAWRLEDA